MSSLAGLHQRVDRLLARIEQPDTATFDMTLFTEDEQAALTALLTGGARVMPHGSSAGAGGGGNTYNFYVGPISGSDPKRTADEVLNRLSHKFRQSGVYVTSTSGGRI